MVWFKVDDGFRHHPKVTAIPRAVRMAVIGLWTTAGGWSGDALTDGAVPRYMVEELGGELWQAEELTRVGLWEVTDDGWLFHDWSDHQPTKAKVMEERAKTADRVAKYRDRKRAEAERNGVTSTPVTPLVTPPYTVGNAPPDPTRPDPTRKTTVVRSLDQHQTAPAGEHRDAAAQLVSGYRSELKARRVAEPPRSVVAALVDHTAALLAEGVPPATMTEALRVWDGKGMGAGILPSVVHELQRPRQTPRRTRGGFDPEEAMRRAQQREEESRAAH